MAGLPGWDIAGSRDPADAVIADAVVAQIVKANEQ